jgi:hypothetical protein
MKAKKSKNERRAGKKKKRRYPVSGRSVFTLAKIRQ